MNFLIRWAVAVFAAWLTVQLGQALNVGLEWVDIPRAILFVFVLALINAFIRPIVKLFTLPLTCLTFGLFSFVVNAVFFWLAAVATGGLDVKNFWAALFGSVVMSILNGIINSFIRRRSN